jgi:hypothetical protein
VVNEREGWVFRHAGIRVGGVVVVLSFAREGRLVRFSGVGCYSCGLIGLA